MWSRYTHDALILAQCTDASAEDLARRQQYPERLAPVVSDRVCNWYLPVFDNPFYGGLMTIFRLADHMQREFGIASRFLICGPTDTSRTRESIGSTFASLSGSSVIALDTPTATANVPFADYSVATLWTTAYVLLGVKNAGLKFYLVQDFEPLFYPAGSTYAQAELTYRFGFYGIANTQSLKDIYENTYGGRAVVLDPCIDTSIFYPDESLRPRSPRRLFYYARPGVPRNCFELAANALKLLKERRGDAIEIVCAGAQWQPAEYGLHGVVRSIGMLPYAQTGDLYRSCHAGLALMMTKHPSYLPFEMMGCGAIVVANQNDANTWLLRDRVNSLVSPPTATCLAENLDFALSDAPELEAIRAAALETIRGRHGDWSRSLDVVCRFMLAVGGDE
ncbi:MAG: O-antigen biosynthesis protein, partial [Alphaproteobacteria bacterium]